MMAGHGTQIVEHGYEMTGASSPSRLPDPVIVGNRLVVAVWDDLNRHWARFCWARDDVDKRRQMYIGYFRCDMNINLPPEIERCTILFWAKHPVLAMRHIISSGKHPQEFAGTTVN